VFLHGTRRGVNSRDDFHGRDNLMTEELRIPLFEMTMCLSNAMDLVSPHVVDHHKRVAHIATSIAAEIGLSASDQEDIMMAGIKLSRIASQVITSGGWAKHRYRVRAKARCLKRGTGGRLEIPSFRGFCSWHAACFS
jgi:hypothetical protein